VSIRHLPQDLRRLSALASATIAEVAIALTLTKRAVVPVGRTGNETDGPFLGNDIRHHPFLKKLFHEPPPLNYKSRLWTCFNYIIRFENEP
jgi:hypothetical protein